MLTSSTRRNRPASATSPPKTSSTRRTKKKSIAKKIEAAEAKATAAKPKSKMRGKSAPTARREVHCYHCGHRHDVSERTQSSSCPKCNKAIKIEDVVVKSYVPVIDLQTCGTITVTKRGRVAATRLQASQGLSCDGSVEGSIESGGPTRLGEKAVWKGKYLISPSLTVDEGAQLHGNITVPSTPVEPDDHA